LLKSTFYQYFKRQ